MHSGAVPNPAQEKVKSALDVVHESLMSTQVGMLRLLGINNHKFSLQEKHLIKELPRMREALHQTKHPLIFSLQAYQLAMTYESLCLVKGASICKEIKYAIAQYTRLYLNQFVNISYHKIRESMHRKIKAINGDIAYYKNKLKQVTCLMLPGTLFSTRVFNPSAGFATMAIALSIIGMLYTKIQQLHALKDDYYLALDFKLEAFKKTLQADYLSIEDSELALRSAHTLIEESLKKVTAYVQQRHRLMTDRPTQEMTTLLFQEMSKEYKRSPDETLKSFMKQVHVILQQLPENDLDKLTQKQSLFYASHLKKLLPLWSLVEKTDFKPKEAFNEAMQLEPARPRQTP